MTREWSEVRREAGLPALFVCPLCRGDRTDFEADPDDYMHPCPHCGQDAVPVQWMTTWDLLAVMAEEEED